MLRIILVLAAVASAQVYENKALGGRYEAPAGWVYGKPDTLNGSVTIYPNRIGLNPIYCSVTFERFENESFALLYPSSLSYFNMSKFFGRFGAAAKAATLANIKDTIISGVHYSSTMLRQNDANRSLVMYMASKGKAVQYFLYETTVSDELANSKNYEENWYAMSFVEPSTAAKPSATSETVTRRQFVDALGRARQEPAVSPRVSVPLR